MPTWSAAQYMMLIFNLSHQSFQYMKYCQSLSILKGFSHIGRGWRTTPHTRPSLGGYCKNELRKSPSGDLHLVLFFDGSHKASKSVHYWQAKHFEMRLSSLAWRGVPEKWLSPNPYQNWVNYCQVWSSILKKTEKSRRGALGMMLFFSFNMNYRNPCFISKTFPFSKPSWRKCEERNQTCVQL